MYFTFPPFFQVRNFPFKRSQGLSLFLSTNSRPTQGLNKKESINPATSPSLPDVYFCALVLPPQQQVAPSGTFGQDQDTALCVLAGQGVVYCVICSFWSHIQFSTFTSLIKSRKDTCRKRYWGRIVGGQGWWQNYICLQNET